VRIRRSFALFSSFRSSFSVAGGSLAKASSVGAKTVNGPSPFSVTPLQLELVFLPWRIESEL
jgi:hypothetical protein